MEEEVKELNSILGATPYYITCEVCGQRWASSVGSKFECMNCHTMIHVLPKLKIIKSPPKE